MPAPPQPIIFVDPVQEAVDLDNQKDKILIIEEKPVENIQDMKDQEAEIKPVLILTQDPSNIAPPPVPVLKNPAEVGQAFDVKAPEIQKITEDLVSLGVSIRLGLNAAAAEFNRSPTEQRFQIIYGDLFNTVLPLLPTGLYNRVIQERIDPDRISGYMVQELSAIAEELAAEQLDGVEIVTVSAGDRAPQVDIVLDTGADKLKRFIKSNGVIIGAAAIALFAIRR